MTRGAALALAALASLAAVPSPAQAPDRFVAGPFSRLAPGDPPPAGWAPLFFARVPVATRYAAVADAERGGAIEAEALASASGLALSIAPPTDRWRRVAWSWKGLRAIEGGDVTRKAGDDYVARLYVTFRLPPERMSPLERAELRLARAFVGDHVPDAGLAYIWDARAPAGTIVPNPYTDRVKMIVVESGRDRLGRWLDYERDLAADWRAAFGGDMPPIDGLAIMTDADDTREHALARYGDVVLKR